jgi:hypothetical protein
MSFSRELSQKKFFFKPGMPPKAFPSERPIAWGALASASETGMGRASDQGQKKRKTAKAGMKNKKAKTAGRE